MCPQTDLVARPSEHRAMGHRAAGSSDPHLPLGDLRDSGRSRAQGRQDKDPHGSGV